MLVSPVRMQMQAGVRHEHQFRGGFLDFFFDESPDLGIDLVHVDAVLKLDQGGDGVGAEMVVSGSQPFHEFVGDQHVELQGGIMRDVFHNPGDCEFMLVIYIYDLAHGIVVTKVFFGLVLGENQRERRIQCCIRITVDKRKGHHVQKRRVDSAHSVLIKRLVVVAEQLVAGPDVAGSVNDFRDLFHERRGQGVRGDCDMIYPSGIILVFFHPVEVGGVLVELVKAQFIQNPNADEQTAGQAESQSGDIDEGITFMAFDVAPDNFKIIFQHSPSPLYL